MMSIEDLTRREAREITPEAYPDSWPVQGNALPIHYRFEPGAADDGATILLPLPLLSAAQPAAFSSPVPGWRLEKITETLRGLPKAVRKSFVPVPEHALRAASELDPDQEFNAALANWLARNGGGAVTAEQIASQPLPEYLRFNIRVIDLNGGVLAQGRDLAEIKRKLRGRECGAAAPSTDAAHRSWDFGALPLERTVERRGLRFTVHPTLRDRGDGVEVAEAASAAEAEALLRRGVLRLAILALPEQYKYARKRCADDRELALLGQGMNRAGPMAESLAERAFADCFLRELQALPRDQEQFQRLLDARRASFGEVADRVMAQTLETLRAARAARQKLKTLGSPAFESLQREVSAQLDALVPPDFPSGAAPLLWPHLPRYLKALTRRLEKAPANQKRDAESMAKLEPAMRAFQQMKAQSHRAHSTDELDRLQWMIEELRVSLFAQDLRTAAPVSEKRVAEQIEKARAEAQRS